MDKKIVAKGDLDFVVGRLLGVGGVLGSSHFILPCGWDVDKVFNDISACTIGGA
jgi:hypothetical protein